MFWTALFVFSLILEVVKGTESVGVVGEDAYLNWTISSLVHDTTRYIRNPANNASLVIFFKDELTPSFTDSRIRFTGDLFRGIVSLTLSNVKLLDAGKYTFVKEAGGQNTFLGGQVLIVAESPSISGIAALLPTAVAGQDFQLNCSALSRSVTPNHNLPMLSEWKRNGATITLGLKYSVSGTILTIINLSRTDNGDSFICRAFEDQRRKSTESHDFALNIIYGPDNMQIIPVGDLIIDEGGSVNITCSAECNPPCGSYQWQNGSAYTSFGISQSLVIPKVRREHAGVYLCTVTNMVVFKRATTKINVTVNYPPTVTIDSRNGSHSETGHMINCSARGLPEQYTYRLTHSSLFSGIEIRQLSYKTISTGVVVHQFANLSYMDTGIYTCTVNNGIPDYKDGSLDQSVSSTVWIKGAPYLTSSDFIFQAEKGQSSRLLVEFYNSLLDAQVTWYRLKNGALQPLQTSDNYNITLSDTMVIVSFYSVHIQQPGLRTTLEIRNTTEEDFTSYEVHAQNYAGEMSSWILQLKPQDSRQQTVSDNDADPVIVGSVLGTCIPIAFLAVIVGVLLYRRRKLCNAEMSSDQSNTYRSTTAEETNLECQTVLNTVAAGRKYDFLQNNNKDANIYLDLHDITGEINDNVNTRSAATDAYDVLTHANNQDHAYDSLNKNLEHTGEKYVYENTKIPKLSKIAKQC